MSAVFGLDFGTTNSSLAVFRDGGIQVLEIDPISPSKKSLKSVILFDEEGDLYVGQEAVNYYLEMGGEYCRFMRSLKTFLPSKSFEKTYVFGKRYGLEELIAIILKRVKTQGEKIVGHSVDDVVMGRPVFFSTDREKDSLAEKRLEAATRKAGFKNINFQYEPIAAALSCEKDLRSGEEILILMGDFGGGTSDFSVMKLRGGRSGKRSRREDVLSIDGISIAGDVFDSLIMRNRVAHHFGRDVKYPDMRGHSLRMPTWIISTLCQWHLIPQLRKSLEFIRRVKLTADNRQAVKNLERLIVENLGFAVFQSIEKAKCELSAEETSVIRFKDGDIRINEILSKTEFESIIDEGVTRIRRCIEETLKKAGVPVSKIDKIIITGGSSFIPKIRRQFIEIFGGGKLEAVDAFTSVAYGLGVTASML